MEIHDLASVSELDRSSFSLPWPESSFRYELTQNPLSRCWVADLLEEEAHPILAGFIVVWLIVDEVHIATLAVRSEYRGLKIGKRLLFHSLVDAYHSGSEKSYLEVRRGNQAAIHLYESVGYRESGVRKRYYKDNGEDAILMDLVPIQINRFESML